MFCENVESVVEAGIGHIITPNTVSFLSGIPYVCIVYESHLCINGTRRIAHMRQHKWWLMTELAHQIIEAPNSSIETNLASNEAGQMNFKLSFRISATVT